MAASPSFAEDALGSPSESDEFASAEAAIEAKVHVDVLDEVKASGESEFWLMLDNEADFTASTAASTKEAKGVAAVEALQAQAAATQGDLLEYLSESGIDHQEYWIVNTIRVNGDIDVLGEVAQRAEVNEIIPYTEPEFIEPVDLGDDYEPLNDFTWGVDEINAPAVWSELGVTGEGVTVASIDTGAQFDHPALVDSYRGNDGSGNFDHDYNFFDVDNQCGSADTCDTNGHGTHVHGTMTGGTDPNGVAFGVAPGSDWIAVNGCCPGGQAPPLLEAGQWIAAPTDQNGENPDPTKAPHVVNNSWGTPANDPIFKGMVDAWWEMGIFPVFSAGNSGPSCNTTGSPGGYLNAFAVGSHSESGPISSFSSRGASQDAEADIKPELSAPGQSVYSAWPGDGYHTISGTSMAAPHVAGTVALMISAAPALSGDVDAIWEILNETTFHDDHTNDTSCGGDEFYNNVYGHGKLDALAAVMASPMGDTGSLGGVVTDADGEALAGATVEVTGPMSTSTSTNADGEYSVPVLMVGEYDISVSLFGYETATGTVEIVEDENAVFDVQLDTLPGSEFSSTVVDAGEHGWPLDATVTVVGAGVSTTTDPLTGDFTVTLPEGEHDLVVDVNYPGYEQVEVSVISAASDVIEVPHTAGCLAPGYGAAILGEGFEGGSTPAGWTVVDHEDAPWAFESSRSNQTPGEGGFAIADSDRAGSGTQVNTELISPVFNLAQADTPVLTFDNDYRHLGNSTATVLFSPDAGETWEEVWFKDSALRGTSEEVDLSEWADATEAQVKFHYENNGTWAWWWMVDNVAVGPDTCEAQEGGIVRGEVTDSANGNAIEGATVSAGDFSVTTDSDGSYWLFTGATGDVDVTASHPDFSQYSQTLDIDNSSVVGADFALGTTEFVTDKSSLNSFVQQGGFWTHQLDITNIGDAGGEITLSLGEGDFEMQGVSDQAGTGWVSVDHDTVFIDAGETVTVSVTTTASADYGSATPGLYTTTLVTGGASPNDLPVVDVSMRVVPQPDQGKVVGTVLASTCSGDVVELAGAQVQFNSSTGQRFDLIADADGFYEYWVTSGSFVVIISKDGYSAEFAQVSVSAGTTNMQNFTLNELGC
ncbi:S8 family serine peptidase [Natronoglycomyces albus]|uniref:S8 family serine peptidase n=1 Tax=Natronoglycomyces albus TaxID=2811108 RepID=A0A895XFK6_9ACTN|nr:S8 family serine peptidase [Natronoglycomyces albus]QSB04631.1 S8 family serine peptidase [Natronoglycomyces albus]